MKRSLAFAVAAIAAVVSTASGTAAPSQGRIVFAADRAPSVSGEIYVLHPNGRRVDLSRSPHQDTNPAVSPDGKRVAFVSQRSPRGKVYEIGIDGHALVQVSPSAGSYDNATTLAWQPHGNRLAISSNNKVWIVRPHRKPIRVRDALGFGIAEPWSPDGRLLLVQNSQNVAALTPSGRVRWTVPPDAGFSGGVWSSKGLVALTMEKRGIDVFDEAGRLRFRLPDALSYPEPTWSPDGRRLAVTEGQHILEAWTSTRRLVLRRQVGQNAEIVWAGRHWLIVTHGPSHWLNPRSPDGKLAIVTAARGSGFSLGVAPAKGGRMKTYAHVPGCGNDGIWSAALGSLQFAGSSHSIVYESRGDCSDDPFSNLYSVAPGGSDLRRVTHVRAQETQPAVSPDGSEIAYVWAEDNGMNCQGCSDGIRLASADGTELRTLTDPPWCTFDDSPTWSPDGQTILFSETNCDSDDELFTVPASGGAPSNLGRTGSEPAWGPSTIAYEGSDGGVWTANPDGSDPVRVAKKGEYPAWSPDGRLAYLAGGFYTPELVVGSSSVLLPFAHVASLGWSPDGTRLLLTASRTKLGSLDVYTIKTNGTDPVRLTKDYGVTGVPRG